MGVDYLRGKTEQTRRGWDRGRWELRQATFFDRHPELRGRAIRAAMLDGKSSKQGEKLLAFQRGPELKLYQGNDLRAIAPSPSPDVSAAIEEMGGAVCVTVAKVLTASHMIEVELQ